MGLSEVDAIALTDVGRIPVFKVVSSITISAVVGTVPLIEKSLSGTLGARSETHFEAGYNLSSVFSSRCA